MNVSTWYQIINQLNIHESLHQSAKQGFGVLDLKSGPGFGDSSVRDPFEQSFALTTTFTHTPEENNVITAAAAERT